MRSLLLEQLKRDEGFRAKPYLDTAGKLTIGYGRNLDDVGVTRGEAEHLLLNDMEKAIEDARALFSNYDYLPPVIQAVLANMAFNLGRHRLSLFVKMRCAIERNNFGQAADEALDSKWAGQVKERAERIAKILRNYNNTEEV